MSAYLFRVIGSRENLLMEVEARSIDDLAYELTRTRFLAGRLLEADGETVSRGMVISVQRIETILEPE